MTAGDQKLRIALAIFDPGAALGPAIAALLREGVPMTDLGLIASADTAARLEKSVQAGDTTATGDPLRRLVGGLELLAGGRNGHITLVASPSLVIPWRSGWRLPVLWGHHQVGDEPRLAPDFERQVRAGSVVLTVESHSLREQWLCTRVLLAQCSSTVLALECSLPPSAS
jgi:hypothetical protein